MQNNVLHHLCCCCCICCCFCCKSMPLFCWPTGESNRFLAFTLSCHIFVVDEKKCSATRRPFEENCTKWLPFPVSAKDIIIPAHHAAQELTDFLWQNHRTTTQRTTTRHEHQLNINWRVDLLFRYVSKGRVSKGNPCNFTRAEDRTRRA